VERKGNLHWDVIAITKEGRPSFLFNITRPEGDAINSGGVPDGFEPIPLEEADVEIQENASPFPIGTKGLQWHRHDLNTEAKPKFVLFWIFAA
jgi:hypothetical protein